ncbi:Hybrid signal transduction histidine kinase K-like protein [Hapsidospora chrysogenum ATCC 11550]|uniref:Hybrid signal transduction histidine kinase K-like protein n=1 Tax=Hapsidospora chrysogenum (strain ATCC 11550 / CBS 779.69 / DSM 880 / IAM 14645 / JCM 23072 / IMI 49137) TaxID=857340 RepID=A0A086T295_HAPC1|nr:Hybrid signal transduction histidine kinase K-like protein [Hapsidospora chrysogenum ATCC 11550]
MQNHNDNPFPRPGSVSISFGAQQTSRLPSADLAAPFSEDTGLQIPWGSGSGTGISPTISPAQRDSEIYRHGPGRAKSTLKQESASPSVSASRVALSTTSSTPRSLLEAFGTPQRGSYPPAPASFCSPTNVDRGSAKRSSSRQAVPDRMTEPFPCKKPRTGASPPGMADLPTTGHSAFAAAAGQPPPEGPGSPLFFSNNPVSKQVSRPPSFHSTDAAASMLARMHHDTPTGAVTTLKMPRANVSSPSPARSGSTLGSLNSSLDMSAPALTPDARSLVPGLQGLSGIDVIELLDQDVRPTFLVDLANPANISRPDLHILFYNTALRTSHLVLSLLTVDKDDSDAAAEFESFKAWVMSPVKSLDSPDPPPPPHKYGEITWTCSTLRKRFRVVSGIVPAELETVGSPLPMTEEPATTIAAAGASATAEDTSPDLPITPVVEPLQPLGQQDYFCETPQKLLHDEAVASGVVADIVPDAAPWHHPDEFTNTVLQAQPERSIFDWTRIPLSENLPEHIRLAKTTDWASTPLGPVEEWPYELRAMANLVMGSPHPAGLYWGPQFIAIYNAAHIVLAGQKHPSLMGSKYSDAWSEIWDEIQPVFQAAWESGQATMKHDNQLFIERNGFIEETFFSWAIVPLVGIDGEVVGLYNPAFENTRRKVTERRMLTLREIGERTATATTMKGFWPQVQRGLEYNEYDVPFGLIYSLRDDTDSETSSLHSAGLQTSQIVLEGSIGVHRGHPAAVETLDLRTSEEGFAPYMRQSIANNGSVVVLSEEGTMPHDLIQGLDWKGFGDPCRTIVVFPVVPTAVGDSVVGFIVMGVNPRRPYDDDYKLFIHLLSRQLATSMASVVLFEEEIKRGQKAARLAAQDRQQLFMQLQLKSQEANEIEYKFARMAEFTPVGMFIANAQGDITYCNDMWWRISQVPRVEGENTWMDSVMSDDKPALEAAWKKLLNDKVTISVEFRFKSYTQGEENTIDTWVLMSAYPEKTEDGSLQSIFGCITDISSQKWAEKVQSERREEAVELKRQQENFIDITSHEMRNPLSAILQCADQIANNITAFAAHGVKGEVETLLEGCLDAANTINLCASHQKRIVDDILTLSKLDSNLLAVTPIDEQPVRVIQRALKMFESELMAHDIEFEFIVDKSFDEYGIKWAKIDPSRLRQVLINLMTNAIKFTQTRDRRSITVTVAASKDVPGVSDGEVHYFARTDKQRSVAIDIENSDEWGHGERINIHCTVEDTGAGLVEEELKLLFQRFQQATPRTHVQYGGSGLGLFISRILTEMQGGQIGVLSKPGQGSKFSFYIQSRMCTRPPADYEHISPFKIARKIRSPAVTATPQTSVSRVSTDAQGKPLFDVLIVEDNIVNQKVLQRQLRSCGNNTFVANHGEEALDALQKSRFWAGQEDEGMDISVILMDLEMPVMDGMTCARRIRELEREGTIIQHIPIIAVTAYARPEQIANAKAAGIDDVISKPFRIPELMPKIEELVGKYQSLSVSS